MKNKSLYRSIGPQARCNPCPTPPRLRSARILILTAFLDAQRVRRKRFGSTLFCALAALALLFLAGRSAYAHGQLHSRACAGEDSSDNCQSGLKNHTACNQWVDRNVYYIDQWCGDAGAYAHTSVHFNCARHHKWWAYAESTIFCGSGASAHSHHAVHSSVAAAPDKAADDIIGLPGEEESKEVPPPDSARERGAFGAANMEVSQVGHEMLFDFSEDRTARLQVDGRHLKPGDESQASYRVQVGRVFGRLVLTLQDGRPSLLQEGIWERVPLRIERHPTVDDLFYVSIDSSLNFRLPGVVEEADVETAGEAHNRIGFTTCIPLTIIRQPHSITNSGCATNCVTFSVGVTGSGPVSSQWYFNGNPIPGANGPSYTICPVKPNDAGIYTVKLSNPCSSVASLPAILAIVKDTTPPVIKCPSNIVVATCTTNAMQVFYPPPTVTDDLDPNPMVICVPPSGSFFPVGTTTVSCRAIDDCTNRSGCTFTVTVTADTIPPVIMCPTNIFVFCAKTNGAQVSYTVTATDNCGVPTVTCLPPSGSHFPTGCTVVVCKAVDAAGNASTCTFKVCVLPIGCYLKNPSFELLRAGLPAPANCGDPINFAQNWFALAGTPDLFRPPWATLAPGNCRGRERPCQGTNYAGLEGGYNAAGVFQTEAMMGTLIGPLSNGKRFRLRACLSLAETAPGPVFIEFVLANSANLAMQQVIHQVWVTQKIGWQQYMPPCFTVPTFGQWDRLIIRAAQTPPGAHKYATGYVYLDNVNICCCTTGLLTPVLADNTVTVHWDTAGHLEIATALGGDWRPVDAPVRFDPDAGLYSARFPRPPGNLFFRIMSPDETVECQACGSDTGAED